MRLTLSTLPQLAVLVKILCLLMVVMCGAMPSTVRSVSLYSSCSRGNITVYNGSVSTAVLNQQNAPYQALSTISIDFSGGLYILAQESDRYICFDEQWRIITLPREKKNDLCLFKESYHDNRYLRYSSMKDRSRFLGFHKNGKPLKPTKKRSLPQEKAKKHRCINFLKISPSGVDRHNSQVMQSKVGKRRRDLLPRLKHPKKQQQQPLQQQFVAAHQPTSYPSSGLLQNSLVASEGSSSSVVRLQQQQQQDTTQLQQQKQKPHHRHRHANGWKLNQRSTRRRQQQQHKSAVSASARDSWQQALARRDEDAAAGVNQRQALNRRSAVRRSRLSHAREPKE